MHTSPQPISYIALGLGLLIFSPAICLAGYHQKRLIHDLLDSYNVVERPVIGESDPLMVSFGLSLMQILNVDEKNGILITNMWLKMEWHDVNLRWNTSEYGKVRSIKIPSHRLWTPDVLLYNSADEGFDGAYHNKVVVTSNGACIHVLPGILKSTCKIDVTWFPFDDQKCELKFGSWTHDGFELNIQLEDEDGGDLSSFVVNGEWLLLGMPVKRNEIYYNCCPEPYIDITFAILIRRRPLYYIVNLIMPCVMIASMALLGFTLSPDSGQKLTLGIATLLSLTFYFIMVAGIMPATSDAVPLIDIYLISLMFEVSTSLASTILILNFHHRNADTHIMSQWFRIVFLQWLPCLLCMNRPNYEVDKAETQHNQSHELKKRSSVALLSNVLEINDDCRCNHPHPHQHRQDNEILDTTSHTCLCSSVQYELTSISKDLRRIVDQLNKAHEKSYVARDWKFAAVVIDRFCFIIFTLFKIIATLFLFVSAPDFRDI